ncbi:MAG TPA: hypothetical protein VE090_02245 [Methylomirabilota bacterium]|nr:hypothetical protein [Methylomirabilota bacterium]
MLRILSFTFLGLLLAVVGFYLAYFYITGVNDGKSPLLLIPSLALVAFGIWLLLQAGKSDAMVVTKGKITTTKSNENKEKGGLENVLQKNSAMTADWEKTENQRTQLKLLEASAVAQKSD